MTNAVYNKIGKTYDYTRKADPMIVKKIIELLSPIKEGNYLDVGCGSGNYTQAIFERGIQICGIDISEEMLAKARKKKPEIDWVCGDARKLPFENDRFDGAICILATHHIKDIESSFQEVARVLAKGNFVIFTSFPELMRTWWLNQYFPKMMDRILEMMHDFDRISKALINAGFKNIKTEKFYITNELQDWFLHAGKYQPHLYLDPKVRSGISTFHYEDIQEEIAKGCEQLRLDISSGKVQQVIEAHENHLGDYVFVICSK